MVLIWNGVCNPEAQQFEIWTNGSHFVIKPLEIRTKMSGFQMVGTIAIAKARQFENWTIRNPTFKKSGFQMFPDFEWSDFRSPLYNVFLADQVTVITKIPAFICMQAKKPSDWMPGLRFTKLTAYSSSKTL